MLLRNFTREGAVHFNKYFSGHVTSVCHLPPGKWCHLFILLRAVKLILIYVCFPRFLRFSCMDAHEHTHPKLCDHADFPRQHWGARHVTSLATGALGDLGWVILGQKMSHLLSGTVGVWTSATWLHRALLGPIYQLLIWNSLFVNNMILPDYNLIHWCICSLPI